MQQNGEHLDNRSAEAVNTGPVAAEAPLSPFGPPSATSAGFPAGVEMGAAASVISSPPAR